MWPYRIELAGEADDADLRHILAATPMPGAVVVGFRREPSYFDAAVVEGSFRQVVACRDLQTGRLVGFGARSIQQRYVNGVPEAVGYLSNLRLLPEHRNRGMVARGYAFFRKLHGDGRARLYLTTIAEGNRLALRLLTSGRGALPVYHFAGNYHTVALPVGRRWSGNNGSVRVEPASAADLPEVLAFLRANGPRRQFFPCYEAEDWQGGRLRDLRPGDVLLARRGRELLGTLAVWDQHSFRQSVIHGYRGWLRWLRPAYNAWARLRGWPPLPKPGESFRYLMAALPVVAGDDPAVFTALLDAALARVAGAADYLLLGLHEADPLLPALRPYRGTRYTTRLYLVCWADGDDLRTGLDGRVPYLELGCL
jgi:hypothetical protein